MKTVIIAEKPSLARNIVNSIGGTFKNSGGWYENDTYCVTFAFGHLFTFYDVEDYTKSEDKRWKLDNLPFIPQRYWYKLKEEKGIKEQFCKIKALVDRDDTDLLVNAGDADNEGSYLVDLIIEATASIKPVLRLWLPEQTEDTIRKALLALPDNSKYKSYSDAGRGRAELDWAMGINYTRFLTLKCGQTVWAGRVLVPITKVIYDRELEIRAFTSEDYYQVQSETEIDGVKLLLECPQKYELAELDQAQAKALLLNGSPCEVVSVTKKQIEIKRPKLFSLSNAQGVLSKRHKIGTEATRTSIIGNATKYAYISIEDNKYQLEPAGESLIQVLDRLHINLYKEKTVETNQWLKQISRGESTPAEAVTLEAEELRKNILNNREVIPAPITTRELPENCLGLCPICNRPVYENSKSYFCSGYKLGCKFSLWKNDRNLEETGVVIDCDLVKELLQKGTAARNEANLIVAFNKDKTKAFLNCERASE